MVVNQTSGGTAAMAARSTEPVVLSPPPVPLISQENDRMQPKGPPGSTPLHELEDELLSKKGNSPTPWSQLESDLLSKTLPGAFDSRDNRAVEQLRCLECATLNTDSTRATTQSSHQLHRLQDDTISKGAVRVATISPLSNDGTNNAIDNKDDRAWLEEQVARAVAAKVQTAENQFNSPIRVIMPRPNEDDNTDNGTQVQVPDVKRDERETADLEYSLIETPPDNQQGLALAVPVNHNDPATEMVPCAVEYDPDAKPPLYRHRRFQLHASLTMLIALAVLVGTVTGILLNTSTAAASLKKQAALPARAIVGIRETIAQFLGPTDQDQLHDASNPYYQALDWIQNEDPMVTTPDSPNFLQRYLLAYVYYSTSVRTPWINDCRPVEGDSKGSGNSNASLACEHERVNAEDATRVVTIPAYPWLSSVHECEWGGCTCDAHGQVTGLDMTSANITGAFPVGIARLPFLRTLTLARGALTGPLPKSLLNEAKHLRFVELNYNQFTGSIPNEWYHARGLQNIDLRWNHLTGTLGSIVGQWKDVIELHLAENSLTGTIPAELGNARSIQELRFNNNLFQGTLPSTLGQLVHNLELWFHRNELTGSIPSEVGRCTELYDIRFNVNKMNGTIPEELYEMSTLIQLDLFDNQFSGTISTKVSNWPDMFLFRIENNQFRGTLPTELGLLQFMQKFSASGNNFEGTVPNQLCVRATSTNGRTELRELQVDCLVPSVGGGGGVAAEIECAFDCCTQCCDRDGANCQLM
jgi:hypothetical protein